MRAQAVLLKEADCKAYELTELQAKHSTLQVQALLLQESLEMEKGTREELLMEAYVDENTREWLREGESLSLRTTQRSIEDSVEENVDLSWQQLWQSDSGSERSESVSGSVGGASGTLVLSPTVSATETETETEAEAGANPPRTLNQSTSTATSPFSPSPRSAFTACTHCSTLQEKLMGAEEALVNEQVAAMKTQRDLDSSTAEETLAAQVEMQELKTALNDKQVELLTKEEELNRALCDLLSLREVLRAKEETPQPQTPDCSDCASLKAQLNKAEGIKRDLRRELYNSQEGLFEAQATIAEQKQQLQEALQKVQDIDNAVAAATARVKESSSDMITGTGGNLSMSMLAETEDINAQLEAVHRSMQLLATCSESDVSASGADTIASSAGTTPVVALKRDDVKEEELKPDEEKRKESGPGLYLPPQEGSLDYENVGTSLRDAQLQLSVLKEQRTVLQADKQMLSQLLSSSQDERNELKQQLQNLQTLYEESSVKSNKRLNDLKTQLQDAESECELIQAEADKREQVAQVVISELREHEAVVTEENQQLQQALKLQQEKHSTLFEDSTYLKSRLASSENETASARSALHKADEAVIKLQRALQENQEKSSTLTSQLTNMQNVVLNTSSSNEHLLQRALENAEDAQRGLENTLMHTESELTRLKAQLQQFVSLKAIAEHQAAMLPGERVVTVARCTACLQRALADIDSREEAGNAAAQRAVARGGGYVADLRDREQRYYLAWAALLVSAFMGNVLRMQKK